MLKKVFVAAGILLACGLSARADFTVMDQIGPNGTFTQGQAANASQTFESAFSTFSIAVVDNFSLASQTRLTQVQAAFLPFGTGTFASFAGVTNWEVAIYSSQAAATASLKGNVADANVSPAAVTVVPFNTDPGSGLVTIPVSITLGAGNYFIAVIPALAFSTFGQLGVYNSTFAGFPGGNNAFQVNPGGGFGIPGNEQNLNSNAAYRIMGVAVVPEPSSVVILSSGLGIALIARRRLRRQITAA